MPGSNGLIGWKANPLVIPSVVSVLNRVLRFFDLKPIGKCEALNQGDLTLVVGVTETDPLENGSKFQSIGPILWLYPGNVRYGGLNKVFNSESMLTACYQAIRDTDYHIVLSLGHQILPKDLAIPPANFRCVCFCLG